MAVAGAAHGDAGGKIQKAVAVHVPNLRPLAVRHDEGIVPRIGRRDDERIAREQLSSLGTRQIGFDARLLHVQSNSPSNAFIMSSARSSSFSPITRGGARIIKLPRTANDTPRSRAVVTNRVRICGPFDGLIVDVVRGVDDVRGHVTVLWIKG